jgi:hypothetical protein
MNFTIGSDPELFWKNAEGKLISCIGKVGGSKKRPKPLPHLGKGYAVQEDNVAAEFNIPACSSRDEFIRAIGTMVLELEKMAKAKGFLLSIVPSGVFDHDQLRNRKAQEAGCDPDYNAWDLFEGKARVNRRPMLGMSGLRSCGGHVAVGHHLPPYMVPRAQDLMLGVPSVLIDKDQARRQLYGKAGCFRPTAFGSEYRTLSNFWIQSADLTGWVYDGTARALEMATSYQGNPEDFLMEEREAIEAAINGGNLDAVKSLSAKFNLGC